MLWMKALHIFFVVCWFSGLFYLPRLLVNYAQTDHPDTRKQLALMANRLYRFVTPFMVLVILLGIGMIASSPGYYLKSGWLWAKLACMLFLIGYHLQCGRYARQALNENNQRSARYYRFFNEVPVLFLLAMILLAVIKPF